MKGVATVWGSAWLRRWRQPSRRNALGLAAVALGGLGFLPQLGGPGYDSALVSGLVLPAVAAAAAALETAAERPSASVAVARGAVIGVVLAVLGFSLMLLHGAQPSGRRSGASGAASAACWPLGWQRAAGSGHAGCWPWGWRSRRPSAASS